MKNRFGIYLSITALALSLGFLPSAHATVINFDTLSGVAPIPNGYGGFNWVNLFSVPGAAEPTASGYFNGMTSSPIVAFNPFGNPGSFADASAGTFTLNSFELTAAWNDGLTVIVTGYLGGVATHIATLIVSTESPTLETLNWSGIDSVGFVSSGGVNVGAGGSGTHFALDDLTVNATSPVPEPSSLILFGTGAIGFAGMVRRRFAK